MPTYYRTGPLLPNPRAFHSNAPNFGTHKLITTAYDAVPGLRRFSFRLLGVNNQKYIYVRT